MAVEYKTENRKRILAFLEENADTTVSVKDIFNYLEKKKCPVNMTTIYRYLDKLEKDGRVISYASEKGEKATYQYVNNQHHCENHLHLQCIKCGKIIHLDCDFMGKIYGHILEKHGFDIQCKNSIIYGICSECREKEL